MCFLFLLVVSSVAYQRQHEISHAIQSGVINIELSARKARFSSIPRSNFSQVLVLSSTNGYWAK
jgi:hypothetical protein